MSCSKLAVPLLLDMCQASKFLLLEDDNDVIVLMKATLADKGMST